MISGVQALSPVFFTGARWPKSLVFGHGLGRFITAVKSMIVPGRISGGFWPSSSRRRRRGSNNIEFALQSTDYKIVGAYRKFSGDNASNPILVDTLGLIIAVVVTNASVDDRLGLVELLTAYFADGTKRLRKIWVDGAYPAERLEEWVHGLKATYKIDLESMTNKVRERVPSDSLALGGRTDIRVAAQ
jgi:hypothetical protein